ncbi:MAG: AEC family transporter [Eubacterium sp.]|nr:AEC family transporter [Eubacterium sp.]
MGEVFIKVAVIFAMIAAGFAANRTGILPKESVGHLSSLLVSVTTPCLALSSIASQDLTGSMVREAWEVAVGSVVFYIAAMAVSYLFVRALKYEPDSDRGVLQAMITSGNTGFMGFPITKAIFGNTIFFLFIIQNIILNVYIFSGAILQINQGAQEHISIKKILRSLANPCLAATLAGIVLLITDTDLPEPVMDFLTTMGDSTIPISMIVVGVQLGSSDLKGAAGNSKFLLCCLANVVLIPALTLAAVWFLPLLDASKLTLVYAAAFPTAVMTVAMAAIEHKNAELMSQGVAVTTLMSMITLPVWAIILMALYSFA